MNTLTSDLKILARRAWPYGGGCSRRVDECLTVVGSPCVLRLTFGPFRLQPPGVRLRDLPVFSSELTICHLVDPVCRGRWHLELRLSLAGSPRMPGRNEFVSLRTGLSPPVALHPACWRRSYFQLLGSDNPESDFHTPDQTPLQAH